MTTHPRRLHARRAARAAAATGSPPPPRSRCPTARASPPSPTASARTRSSSAACSPRLSALTPALAGLRHPRRRRLLDRPARRLGHRRRRADLLPGAHRQRVVPADRRRALLAAGAGAADRLRAAPGRRRQRATSPSRSSPAPGSPAQTTIEPGVKVQSVPGPNEKPQTFETIEPIDARVAWNALTARLTEPQVLDRTTRQLYLDGTDTQLQAGDAILIVGEERGELTRQRALGLPAARDGPARHGRESHPDHLAPTARHRPAERGRAGADWAPRLYACAAGRPVRPQRARPTHPERPDDRAQRLAIGQRVGLQPRRRSGHGSPSRPRRRLPEDRRRRAGSSSSAPPTASCCRVDAVTSVSRAAFRAQRQGDPHHPGHPGERRTVRPARYDGLRPERGAAHRSSADPRPGLRRRRRPRSACARAATGQPLAFSGKRPRLRVAAHGATACRSIPAPIRSLSNPATCCRSSRRRSLTAATRPSLPTSWSPRSRARHRCRSPGRSGPNGFEGTLIAPVERGHAGAGRAGR